MKNMRIPLSIALGVAIIGVILGSFFDLNISQAIASATNGFGLTISAIGPTIGFGAVALMGGGFIALAVKGKYHVALRVIFYVLAGCCIFVSIYYPYGEYFGVNGFYHVVYGIPKWVALFIVMPLEAGAMLGGYFLFKDCKNRNMWIVFVIVIGLLLTALLVVIPNVKDNMHRPRFRLIAAANDAGLFHRWFEPCKDYKELMEKYGQYSLKVEEDFKSFPSGHTAEASILIVGATFFPLANKKFEKYQLPVFLGSCGVVLLVAFARILAAAHFLSDVSVGATIVIGLTLIANEVVMRIQALHIKEEADK